MSVRQRTKRHNTNPTKLWTTRRLRKLPLAHRISKRIARYNNNSSPRTKFRHHHERFIHTQATSNQRRGPSGADRELL